MNELSFIKILKILQKGIDNMTRMYYNIIVARDKLHKLLSRRKATERGNYERIKLNK